MKPKVDRKWEMECDARTLLDAATVMADPERFKAAVEFNNKKRKAFKTLEDLEKYAEEFTEEKSEDESDSDEE